MKKFRFYGVILVLLLAAVMPVGVHGADKVTEIPVFAKVCGEASDRFDGIALPDGAKTVCEQKAPTSDSESSPALVAVRGSRYVSDDFEDEVSLTFEVPPKTSFSDCIGVGVYVADGSEYPEISLSVGGRNTLRGTSPVVSGKPFILLADVGTQSEKSRSITVTVSSDGPSAVYLTFPFTVDGKLDYLKEKNLDFVSVFSGSADFSGGKLTVNEPDTVVSFGVRGAEKGSVIYAAVGAASEEAEIKTVRDGSELVADIPTDGVTMMRLVAEDAGTVLTVPTDGTVIDRLGFTLTDESDTHADQTVVSLSASDGKLRLDGRLFEEEIDRFQDEKIGLYAVSALGGEPRRLSEASVSSRFSMSVSESDVGSPLSDTMFFTAVDDGEKLHVLSEPRFADPVSREILSGSEAGLYGADPVDVFESGVPKVMVDVDISRLCLGETVTGTSLTRGGYVFGVDGEYLGELDSEMDFHRSSGTSVYLKLVCSSPIRSKRTGEMLVSMNSSAKEFLVRTDSEEAVNMYLAIVSFLCERYPNTASIVISSGINSPEYTAKTVLGEYSYAADAAYLARLTYGIASEKLDGFFVTVPLVTGEMKDGLSAELFAALFSERLSVIGSVPWAAMFETSEPEAPDEVDAITSDARRNGTSPQVFSVLCYAPAEADGVTELFAEFCRTVDSAAVRGIFLCTKKLGTPLTHGDYRKLCTDAVGDSAIMLYGEAESGNGEAEGFSAWDFSDKHSTEGWIAGCGIESLSTVGEKGSRVLHAVTESTSGSSAGILLCTPASPLNLAAAPKVEFVYDVQGSGEVVFVFGSGENRMEFSSPAATDGGTMRAVCDTTPFLTAGSVDYLGVIIYSKDSVSFDLREINLIGDGKTEEELLEAFGEKDTSSRGLPFTAREITVSAFVLLLFVTVSLRMIFVLRRHDKANGKRK